MIRRELETEAATLYDFTPLEFNFPLQNERLKCTSHRVELGLGLGLTRERVRLSAALPKWNSICAFLSLSRSRERNPKQDNRQRREQERGSAKMTRGVEWSNHTACARFAIQNTFARGRTDTSAIFIQIQTTARLPSRTGVST